MKQRSLQQRAASGVVVGAVALAMNFFQAIVQVPLLLHFWDPQTYGLWGTLVATISLVTSLDSGHQNYLGNRFCELWVQSQNQLRHDLVSGIRAAVVLASIEILVGVGVLVGGGVVWMGIAHSPISHGVIIGALALYLVYWAVFGAVGGILVRLYAPAGLFARGQWFGIISRFLAFLAIIIAASLGGSVFEAMAAQIILGTVFNLYLLSDLRRRFPDYIPWWQGGDWITAWHNFRFSLVLTANGVLEQIAANGLVLLVGRMLSPVAVALYSTVRTVANLGIQGTNIMLNPLAPDLVRYHLTQEGDKLVAVFSTSWFIGTSLIAGGLSVGVFVLEPLYDLWTRGILPLDRLLFTYLGAAVAVRQWAAPFQSYLATMNQLRPQIFMAVTRAVLGLGLAAVLLPLIGLPAAGLGALAAEAGAGLIAAFKVRSQIRGMGAIFPLKSAALALGQIVFSLVVWLLFATEVHHLTFCAVAGLIAIGFLALWQWRLLPGNVKERLTGMVYHKTLY